MPCEFVICGDGQHSGSRYFEEIRQRVGNLPVVFLPWQSDVGPVLRSLDLLLLPSTSMDATPRVIIEALSAAVPVIAYRTEGFWRS